MAELHLERKERSTWPWLLAGALLLALVLWFVFGRAGDGEDDVADVTPVTEQPAGVPVAPAAGAGTMPEAVTEYLRFAEVPRDTTAGGLAHEYTADGLQRLAAALGALVEQDTVSAVAVQPRLAEIRQRADAMRQNPQATTHARLASEGLVMAAALMTQIQQGKYPALEGEATELRDAAAAIRSDGQLLEQTAEVQRFFERAAAMLQRMATSSANA